MASQPSKYSKSGIQRNGKNRPSLQVTGRALAHCHYTPSQKAAIAAMLALGEAERVEPTILQCVADAKANLKYVKFMLKLTPETRARVAAGEITVAEAARANGLLEAFLAATPETKAALGVAIGADEIFDTVVAPALL